MGADTTSTHLIFFIAGTVVAAAAAAALTTAIFDVTGNVDERGKVLGATISTDVKIANDPAKVPNDPVLIYVKNTGSSTLNPTLVTLVLNGQVVDTTYRVIDRPAGIEEWRTGEILELSHAASLAANEDHRARVVTENGVDDELLFRVG